MKRNLIVTLLLLVLNAQAAEQYFYQNAFFRTNVYLADDTNTPLHQRVPTGAVVRVRSGNVEPVEAWSFDAPITIRTNGFIITYKPDVAAGTNSIVIDPNGQITLRRFVSGAGWYEVILNPTNPLPTAMTPSPLRTLGDFAIGSLVATATNVGGAKQVSIGFDNEIRNSEGGNSVRATIGDWAIITNNHEFVWGTINGGPNYGKHDDAATWHVSAFYLVNQFGYSDTPIFYALESTNVFYIHNGRVIMNSKDLRSSPPETENTYTGGTMRLMTTNGTTFRWE